MLLTKSKGKSIILSNMKKANRKFILILGIIITVFAAVTILFGCSGKGIKIVVMSDVHLLSQELFTDENYLKYAEADKMEHISEAIMRTVADKLPRETKYLLISGDLTENGDEESHLVLAGILKEIENRGTEVFVINGNHDVATKSASIGVKSSGERFKEIYADFGYNQAVAAFDGSLSYAADLGKTHRLIAVDNIEYFYDAAGEIKKSSLGDTHKKWIMEQIKRCKTDKRVPVLMSHVPFKNHFPKIVASLQDKQDYIDMTKEFADNGAHYAFTGHLHVQDIQKIVSESGNVFYDISTPSAVHFPSEYREVKLKKDGLETVAVKIDEVKEEYLSDFVSEEDREALKEGLHSYCTAFMKRELNKAVANLDKPYGRLGSFVSGDGASAKAVRLAVQTAQEALNAPIYKEDENGNVSIERVMDMYGVTVPETGYKTLMDAAVSYASSVFSCEWQLKDKPERELIGQFVYYYLYQLNQKSGEFKEIFPEYTLNIDMEKLVNTGILECYDSDFVDILVAAVDIPIDLKDGFGPLASLQPLISALTGGAADGITDYFTDKEIRLYDLMYDGVLGKYAPEMTEKEITDYKFEVSFE